MKKTVFWMLLFASITSWAATPAVKPFKAGDRVAFTGNSITEGGFYHSFIWLYYMTRFPNQPITIYNCGVGGDTALEIDNRLEGDVIGKKPSVIILTFGMNDSGYFEYNGDNPQAFADERVAKSYASYLNIQKKLLNLPHTRITLMGGSPYDETAQIEGNTPFRNKNKAMLRIVDFQKKAAETNQWEFVDLNEPMRAISLARQKEDPTFALCGKDRVHPDNDGHMVMAYLFLRSQGFAGKKVADININAAKRTVLKSENCKISALAVTPQKISFDYLAQALPYPSDTIARGWGSAKSQAEAGKIIPFTEEMNQELLTVSGLQGSYELTIDEEKIGTYSDKELAAGINLATCIWTPQYRQALKVMHLNGERFEIERRTREFAWIQYNFFLKHPFSDSPETVERYDKEAVNNGWLRGRRDLFAKAIHPEMREMWQTQMDMLISKIYSINKPVVRKIVLKPIGQ